MASSGNGIRLKFLLVAKNTANAANITMRRPRLFTKRPSFGSADRFLLKMHKIWGVIMVLGGSKMMIIFDIVDTYLWKKTFSEMPNRAAATAST